MSKSVNNISEVNDNFKSGGFVTKELFLTFLFGCLDLSFIGPFIASFISFKGFTLSTLGYILIQKNIARVLSDLPFGVLFDMIGAKKMFFMSRAFRITSILLLLFCDKGLYFVLSLILYGFSMSSFYGKIDSYIMSLLEKDKRTDIKEVFAIYNTLISLVIIFCGFISISLYNLIGYVGISIVTIVTSSLSLFVLYFMPNVVNGKVVTNEKKISVAEVSSQKALKKRNFIIVYVSFMKRFFISIFSGFKSFLFYWKRVFSEYKKDMSVFSDVFSDIEKLKNFTFLVLANVIVWRSGDVFNMLMIGNGISPSNFVFFGTIHFSAIFIGQMIVIFFPYFSSSIDSEKLFYFSFVLFLCSIPFMNFFTLLSFWILSLIFPFIRLVLEEDFYFSLLKKRKGYAMSVMTFASSVMAIIIGFLFNYCLNILGISGSLLLTTFILILPVLIVSFIHKKYAIDEKN